MEDILTYQVTENQKELIECVLRDLPDWFGIESAILNYVKESEGLTTFTADVGSVKKIGFLTLKIHNSRVAEIFIIGVKKAYHRKGIGKTLVNHAKRFLTDNNYDFLTVKTLSSKKINDHYKQTRMFYEQMGFVALEEFDNIWGSDNPCLFMLMVLKK